MKKLLLFWTAIITLISGASIFAETLPADICTMEYNPVCGVNMKTYSNACVANAVGVDYTAWSCDQKSNLNSSQLVLWAYHKWITSFDTVDGFQYDDLVRRQQASKMIVNFAKALLGEGIFSEVKNSNCNFTDKNLFEPTLIGSIETACSQNIFKWDDSMGSLKFYPHADFTRWQAIAVMMRVINGVLWESSNPRYQSYVQKALDLNYLSSSQLTNLEGKITRWDILVWMYTINKAYHHVELPTSTWSIPPIVLPEVPPIILPPLTPIYTWSTGAHSGFIYLFSWFTLSWIDLSKIIVVTGAVDNPDCHDTSILKCILIDGVRKQVNRNLLSWVNIKFDLIPKIPIIPGT